MKWLGLPSLSALQALPAPYVQEAREMMREEDEAARRAGVPNPGTRA